MRLCTVNKMLAWDLRITQYSYVGGRFMQENVGVLSVFLEIVFKLTDNNVCVCRPEVYIHCIAMQITRILKCIIIVTEQH